MCGFAFHRFWFALKIAQVAAGINQAKVPEAPWGKSGLAHRLPAQVLHLPEDNCPRADRPDRQAKKEKDRWKVSTGWILAFSMIAEPYLLLIVPSPLNARLLAAPTGYPEE